MEPVHPVDDSFDIDYDPPMQNQVESMEVEMDEDKENESDARDTTEEESIVKTRYGRSSKRRHLGSDCSYTSRNSQSTSAASGENSRGSELPSYQEESMEVDMDEDEESESEVGDAEVNTGKTRYGRLSRRRHLASDFSYTSRNSQSTSAASGENTRGSELPESAKKKKRVESRGRAPTPSESISNALDIYSSRNLRRSTRNRVLLDERDDSDQPMESQGIPREEQDILEYDGPMIQEMESHDNNQIFIDPEDPPEDCNDPSERSQEGAPVGEVKPPTEAEGAQNTAENEVKPEKQDSGTSQELNGNDFVPLSSHIRLLEALQTIMITRNVRDLQEHLTRIERTIEKYKEKGIEEEKITINGIRTSLMNTLLIVNKGARKEVIKGEETTSLKEFLIAFYEFVVHLNLKSLDNFSNRLKAMMEELTEEDKKFPIKNASIGLLSILVVAAP